MRKLLTKRFVSIAVPLLISAFVAGCAGDMETQSIQSEYKEDFYQAVNQEWLDNAVIPEGEAMLDSFSELDQLTQKQTQQILEDLLQQEHPLGSKEQKLADFYQSALDMESRNASGASLILPYLER